MAIVGHVSPAMLKLCSHIRVKAKKAAMTRLADHRKKVRDEAATAEKELS